ncbi:MAG: xanthine dehydrogenase family protein molybdopterin-binding subunit [Candidatus Rokubacteria bacterium]|nr:xanthine dehydrogenase family protein molybdopterin-binding subunit [Candidatus Rokubacteria bacterium]
MAKVTGAEQYAPDIALSRMWYARVLRSPHAHARITRIDTSVAEALGAVCLTFADIPKVKYNERIVSTPPHLYRDRYVLADKARHVGEAVAAVAAPTEALAEKALRAIKVDYEPLQTILNAEDSMRSGAEPIHASVRLGDAEIPIENNVAVTRSIQVGDIDKGFAESEFVIEREFTTHPIYHAQMETKSVVCRPEPDEAITVWATAQSIHNVRQLLGEIYSIPLHKVNVRRVALGGTFGSSIQVNSVIPICVGLALRALRPVKLVSTREEDMYDHVRYPTNIRLRLGLKRDGTLVAGHMRAIVDIGAHNIQAFPFLGVLAGFWASLYRLPHMKYEGRAVYTNRTPSCAMQGFGAPQVTFAVESLMDEIAHELGMDPIDLKLKNYVGLGGTFWGHGPTVQSIVRSDGVPELVGLGAKKIGWKERPRPGSQTGRYRRGIGMARGFHTSGVGHPKATGAEMIDYSGAFVKINEDGSVDVVQSLMDHGGGTLEAIAKIVADELGVPLEKVGLSPVDTRTTVYDVTTHATRGVYAGGAAAQKAARKAKAILLDYASRLLGVLPEALVIEPDVRLGQGVIHCPSLADRRITVGAVAKACQVNSWGTIAAVESLRQVNCPPAYVTYFVEVEVDTDTGNVRTRRAAIGSDCGTVVNPDLAAGQLTGGLSKGAGYALIEDCRWDAQTGELLSRGFWIDGKTPSVSESPLLEDVHTDFAKTYEPSGPFGAKGLGEASTNPCAGAYANALYNALGVRFYELPVTPEKILAALQRKEPAYDARDERRTAVAPAR